MARYRIKPWTVEAERLEEPRVVLGVQGLPGDWLITRDDGYQFVISENQFLAAYEPCPEGEG